MFDFDQHGPVEAHRYRSHYDAQPGSTTKCAFCGRTIRFCYVMLDQHEKTFIIGSCDFQQYASRKKVLTMLQAAQIVQESDRENQAHDVKVYGTRADVRDRRKDWVVARREGMKLVRTWRNEKR